MPAIKVKPIDESLDFILTHRASVARFGDGEMDIIAGHSIPYQDYDERLAGQLREIMGQESSEDFLVCLSDVFEGRGRYNTNFSFFWNGHLERFAHLYEEICQAPWYGSTFISRPYIDLEDKSPAATSFAKLKQIWEGQDVLIVEGETSRSGVGNDLFVQAKSVSRIICPSRNAYAHYDQIASAIRQQGKDKLVLLMLGPTAKVLSYNLAKEGFWTIDLGHIDSEYEWFLMGATHKVKLGHKHTAEHNYDEGLVLTEDVDYQRQIVARVPRQVQVAFAVNNNYAKYLGATLLSLLDHHQDEVVVAHVLYTDLEPSLLADLKAFAASQANLDLVLHAISQGDFMGIPIRTQQFPLESFCRFLLPDLLPGVERILYLDVDILVKGSLVPLFDLDLEGKELGAVRESDIYAYYQWYLDELGFSAQDDYFSSGVLLMDLVAMRRAGTARKLLEMALEKAQDLKFPDQDILNTYYRGDVVLLSPAYNYTDRRKLDRELSADQVIIEHFNGDIKAWQAQSKIPDYLEESARTYRQCQARYREILAKPRVTLLLEVDAYNSFFKDCMESLAEQTYANLRVVVTSNPEDQELEAFLRLYQSDSRFLISHESPALSDHLGVAFGFVAADSTLDPYYVERLLASLDETGSDIAVTSFVVFNQQHGTYRIYPENTEPGQVFKAGELAENLYRQAWLETETHRSLYGKLYRPQLLQTLGMPSLTRPTQLALAFYLAAHQVVVGPQRLRMQRFHWDHEMSPEGAVALVERFDDLIHYRQALKRAGKSTLLFDAAYEVQVRDLSQKAQALGEVDLVKRLTDSLAQHRLLLQLGKV